MTLLAWHLLPCIEYIDKQNMSACRTLQASKCFVWPYIGVSHSTLQFCFEMTHIRIRWTRTDEVADTSDADTRVQPTLTHIGVMILQFGFNFILTSVCSCGQTIDCVFSFLNFLRNWDVETYKTRLQNWTVIISWRLWTRISSPWNCSRINFLVSAKHLSWFHFKQKV